VRILGLGLGSLEIFLRFALTLHLNHVPLSDFLFSSLTIGFPGRSISFFFLAGPPVLHRLLFTHISFDTSGDFSFF